jgi:Tfp pilus assembly protein PilN
MIKINLLKNRGTNATRNTGSDLNYETAFNTDVGSSSSGSKDLLVKILLMFLGVGALVAYESYNIGLLKSRLNEVTTRKNALMQEVQEKSPIAEKARAMQGEILDLESRIKTIKDLSRIRLREIKTVDYIQNVIPERVWLTGVVFAGDKLTLEGSAISDEQLNHFTESLEKKSSFKDVIVLKSVEQKAKDGTIKIFTITLNVLSTD